MTLVPFTEAEVVAPGSTIARFLRILVTDTGRIALFGYYDAVGEWHFSIVPCEWRHVDIIEKLNAYLQDNHQATLACIAGDTIADQMRVWQAS